MGRQATCLPKVTEPMSECARIRSQARLDPVQMCCLGHCDCHYFMWQLFTSCFRVPGTGLGSRGSRVEGGQEAPSRSRRC